MEEKAGNSDTALDASVGEEIKEDKKEEKKPLFDPQNSAAMAKIAQGLRAKVHALLNKESKLWKWRCLPSRPFEWDTKYNVIAFIFVYTMW